jgi:hypothetical protein
LLGLTTEKSVAEVTGTSSDAGERYEALLADVADMKRQTLVLKLEISGLLDDIVAIGGVLEE